MQPIETGDSKAILAYISTFKHFTKGSPMAWTSYQPEMSINGKYLRIKSGAANLPQGQNYYDGRFYKLPGGLVGRVESIVPFKTKFEKTQAQNRTLWVQINPFWKEDSLYVKIDQLDLVEVAETAWG
jgi:hypothetical protein